MSSLRKFSKRQLLTLGIFGIADFCNALCVSLQAPFFPHEAEMKGATAAEYGFVFGIFELVVFLSSPLYGQYMKSIGPRVMFHGGILLTGACSILFGLLDKLHGRVLFITSAFVVRIVEAMGNAAFLTASFSIIANEFPHNVATAFAALETFFGLGLIVGPTIGGVLYQLGGYTTPFAILGALLFITALITSLVLPAHATLKSDKSNTGRLLEVLKIRGIPICASTIMTTSMSISFLSATLEPHVRQFNLTAVEVGLVFVVTGATYAGTATFWGWLCDKYLHPKTVTIIGGLLLVIGISFIGPIPYIPLYPSLKITIFGLLLHGLGIGARLVSSFTDALQTAIDRGLPNNLDTYGLISGLWTSSFALGAFIGPTISGILYDSYGFANASVFIIILIAILAVLEYVSFTRSRRPYYKGYVNLDTTGYTEKYENGFGDDRLHKIPHYDICNGKSNGIAHYNSKEDLLRKTVFDNGCCSKENVALLEQTV